jgi:hypothetical protein
LVRSSTKRGMSRKAFISSLTNSTKRRCGSMKRHGQDSYKALDSKLILP